MMANRKVKGEIMCDRGGHGVKSPGCALSNVICIILRT